MQKHAATRLHYDFRLEMEGVLRSWAVPKGPSLDPAEKRFAAHVEDHPLEYGGFEGVIPKGQYGGGTVLLWDRGTWRADGDPVAAYRNGSLKFELLGEKMRGRWALVRMGGARHAEGKEWLLIKERDDEARPGHGSALVDKHPTSVLTGRTLDAVAKAKDRVWQSATPKARKARGAPRQARATRAANAKPTVRARAARRVSGVDPSTVDGAHKSPIPTEVRPELATLAASAPTGDAWIHEIKFDGYRVLCRVAGGRATLFTRTGKDWTARFGSVANAAEALPVREAILDGEAVIVRPDGTTDFQSLQDALSEGRTDEIVYYAFDLLYADGYDLRDAPLVERKRLLASLLAGAGPAGTIRYSDHVEGGGREFFDHACKLSLEGAVSKRADSPYVSGRGGDWRKVKCVKGQEVVVVGFTDPGGTRSGIGALLVGVHEDGRLRFAGRVGTGFTQASLDDLAKKLRAIEVARPTVVDPPSGVSARGVHWVKPALVAEVSFTEWTRDGRLRHPSFKGLRTDKPARDIVHERTKPFAGGVTGGASRSVKSQPVKPQPVRKSAAAVPRAARTATAPEVAGVALTHPDRVLYPEHGPTKGDLARYYESVAEWMLPHVAHRPLTLVRCPKGQGSKCFFQKHATDGMPAAVRRIPIRQDDGVASYMEIESVEGLVALVQMGALEFHVWGSRTEDVERPDRIVFDLDPDPSVAWPAVVDGALEIRERLGDLDLESFVKTTGGKGLHVVVPIRGKATWDDAKSFSRAVADAVVRDAPDRYTANLSKAKRHGRIFIDYLRNGRGATAVAPYSSRARPGAPIATPLHWKELNAKLRPDAFTVQTFAERRRRLRADPWEGMASVRQSITAAVRRVTSTNRPDSRASRGAAAGVSRVR